METCFWTVWILLYHTQNKAPYLECGVSQRRFHTGFFSLCRNGLVRVLADSLTVTAFHLLARGP